MKRLTEEQVELAERYAAHLETIERLRGLLPSEEEAGLLDEYVQNVQYIADHQIDWTGVDAELADNYQQNLAYIFDHQTDWTEGDAELAESYQQDLAYIVDHHDDWSEADAQQAAEYADNLRDIAQLTS